MGAIGFYGFYIYLAFKCIDNKKIKLFIIAFLATIIVSIGITRIYLGVHYPTDVIAGFFVTIAIIIINVKRLDKIIVDKKEAKTIGAKE
jgi:undecaprenyl-diphosphatase